ncbi:nucleotidyltransferase family protein [Caproiciproducens faecalis]|uniref:Nucleotidyltransferase family protein n=1 Tax=Caproiciproducens faecalis TaxID=2820301 RepID=A0ABS7DM21_9FIRM|nr:nucleotidyltransferase family protein [Caproiciproducens faecalis]MBW7572349.1 nucleotidyltransferase family protein [Caproiciproducens faecalis]
MNDWKKILILPDTKIQEAIEIIDLNSLQIAVVTDRDGKLLGTVTDGDIRRGILKGVPLSNPVEDIMNAHPVTIPEMKDKTSILNILKINQLRHLPVVDGKGRVIGIEWVDDLITLSKYENWVVIMAGGLGKRLSPLTDDCPKPMLKIADKPVLETILNQFIKQGFHQFCFSVNYLSEQIREYFGDGSKWGVEIRYIAEKKEMGTAGSLSLFPVKTELPVIIINGDILTKLSFEQLLNFHLSHQARATVAVTTYDFQVPYGVVKVNKDRLIGFDEKPVYASFINAGIYVLNPEVLGRIPSSYFDMNHLLEIMLEEKEPVCIFPIREYWIDIGKIEDFHQASLDFPVVFQ